MNFHKSTPDAADNEAPLTPCPQMRTLLSRLADGSLQTGPLHWYATHHTAGCAHCADALMSLRAISERLRTLGTVDFDDVPTTPNPTPEGKGTPDALALTADRWDAVKEAWETADTAAPNDAAA